VTPSTVAAHRAASAHRTPARAPLASLAALALLPLLTASCGRLFGSNERTTEEDVRARLPPAARSSLRAVPAFAAITEPADRSRALFWEASRVMLHPRCANCHPAGDVPAQGDDQRPHDPAVTRGPDDHGGPAMECTSCHQDQNAKLARVPGAPHWALAPRSMAWIGKTPAAICEQVKDPARNGGKTLDQIVEHGKHDPLVAWGWNPGAGRQAAPGDQETFGELLAAWAQSGAHCPKEKVAR
jgi:hypothetical protein